MDAICGHYRAGRRIGRAHDDADRFAGRRAHRPALVVWTSEDDIEARDGNPFSVPGL
jgi:haloacetate dehalogenase